MGSKGNNREVKSLESRIPSNLCLQGVGGRTGLPKICISNHECRRCAFDQWIDEIEMADELSTHPGGGLASLQMAA
jgi:hypothetical protein